eukprot:4218212-Prymnesium_polylepis.1
MPKFEGEFAGFKVSGHILRNEHGLMLDLAGTSRSGPSRLPSSTVASNSSHSGWCTSSCVPSG